MSRTRSRSARPLAPAPLSRFELPRRSTGVLAQAERALALEHARALLEQPTAPYFEDGPRAVVRRFVAERPGFALEEDEHANLLVRWEGRGRPRRSAPLLAFSAHLDHPAFSYAGTRGGKAHARLHGGVGARFLPGAPLRFFAAGTCALLATARIEKVVRAQPDDVEVELADVRGRLVPGCFGVFDLAAGVIRGARLHARVCDDLVGAASILAALDLLAREDHERPLLGIFTRAEETGFVGCLGLMRAGGLPRGTRVIGLECSPRRATAKVGRGPVVRAGDKQSIFDPALTLAVEEAARALCERVPGFRWQRALMDGGSCESTVYNHYGTPAAGVCLALGNYHNCGPAGAIAPEFVDWHDFEGLVALLCESARRIGRLDPRERVTQRLQRIWEREEARLAASTSRMRKRESPR